MELLISILVGLGIIEAYAWLPAACQWLLESAISHLPTENQERCREEWTESLEALPNTALRLVHAVTFIFAARTITVEYWEQTFGELDEAIFELSKMQDELQELHIKVMRAQELAQELITDQAAVEKRLDLGVGDLLLEIAKTKEILSSDQTGKIPEPVAEEVIRWLLQAGGGLSTAKKQLLEAIVSKRDSLLEKASHLMGHLHQMDGILQKHVPIFNALQQHGVPSRDMELATERACDKFMKEVSAWQLSFTARFGDDAEQDHACPDVQTALTGLSAALVPLRAATAKLRSCRNSVVCPMARPA